MCPNTHRTQINKTSMTSGPIVCSRTLSLHKVSVIVFPVSNYNSGGWRDRAVGSTRFNPYCPMLRADYGPRSLNAMNTETLRRSRTERKVTTSGSRVSGPCGGHKEGPQGRNRSVTPLHCVNVGP